MLTPCDVTATFSPDGQAHPRQLIWEGQTLAVHDTGRRWGDEDGQHVLVRVSDGRVFELAYNGASWRGRLVNSPPSFA